MTQFKPFSYEAINAARLALATAREQVEAAAILQMVSDFGSDIFPVGTVFRFEKTYSDSTTRIHVVVKNEEMAGTRRPGQVWSATTGGVYTWDDLVMFLVAEHSPTTVDDVDVIYPEGYEPPATHVHGPECYGLPADAFEQFFGNKPVPAPADEDEELSTSDIVLTSTGEQAADEEPDDDDEDEVVDSPDEEDEADANAHAALD